MPEQKTRKGKPRTVAKPVRSEKRSYFKQADFPQTTLQQAQKIASALVDNYAGKDASPPDVALAIGVSPTSSAWPQIAGSSNRAQTALDIVKANGSYAGIIRETPTGPFVNLDSSAVPAPAATPDLPDEAAPDTEGTRGFEDSPMQDKQRVLLTAVPADGKSNRVFITHGKQKAIVTQIKELLSFGHFEPVVSIERESTAVPVPEKVFEDMRSCSAGVIHVGAEGKYLDRDGNEHTKINDNVLIEIGAAMALYGKKVILLVEVGVTLPSNLQGLYRCEFSGDRLDYDATMKLLKTFTQFR